MNNFGSVNWLTEIFGLTGVGSYDFVRQISKYRHLAPWIREIVILADEIYKVRSMSSLRFDLFLPTFLLVKELIGPQVFWIIAAQIWTQMIERTCPAPW